MEVYSLDCKLVVEFVGTFIFAFTVGMATAGAVPGSGKIFAAELGFTLALGRVVVNVVQPGQKPQGDIQVARTGGAGERVD
jgi:hypothetical protein